MTTDEQIELAHWGDCCNTHQEERKQYVYADHMRIEREHYSFIVRRRNIIDIGGGPVSMLLKCQDLGVGAIVDPLKYPTWTQDRYRSKNIHVLNHGGETLDETGWHEVWIYNCLQHVQDPKKIIENAKRAAPVLRIFEWIDLPAHPGHPQELKADKLDKWIGGRGNVSRMTDVGVFGTLSQAYYGVFSTS